MPEYVPRKVAVLVAFEVIYSTCSKDAVDAVERVLDEATSSEHSYSIGEQAVSVKAGKILDVTVTRRG